MKKIILLLLVAGTTMAMAGHYEQICTDDSDSRTCTYVYVAG